MKIVVNDYHLAYKYRGLIEVEDRVKIEEQFLDENFIYEFTKQISSQISTALRFPIGQINKHEGFISFDQYLKPLDLFEYENSFYFRTTINLARHASSFWTKCISENNFKIDPRNLGDSRIKFELVSDIPLPLKKITYDWILKKANSIDEPEEKERLSNMYNRCLSESVDKWVQFFEKNVFQIK